MAAIKTFAWARLMLEHQRGGEAYLEFLRVPSLNVGIYSLGKGTVNAGERVHPREDEVYSVVTGRAVLRGGPDVQPVESGDVLFVPAGLEHWFESISDDLTLLVFFSPARAEIGASRETPAPGAKARTGGA